MDDRIRIRDAIQNGRIQEATSLVNQLHPELLDNDRYLYFHLQVCEFTVLSYVQPLSTDNELYDLLLRFYFLCQLILLHVHSSNCIL